tara:strand:- start:957 stop:2435 length:1479 start_codon:yes stop_codon:yes gene_type:complete
MTNNSLSLKTAIDKLSSAKVICVGDVMLDKFIYGEIERISPEAPIPVLRCISETSMLGGGGNVARNIIGLGGYCKFVSVVGKDSAGKELISQVGKLKNLDARLITDPKRQTSIKTRFIASNQQVMRADTETIEPITSETEKLVLDAISREASDFSAIVLADYGKGVLSDGLAQKILSMAKTNKIPVVVDPQGSNYFEYDNASIVTPNKKELQEATGLAVETTEDIVAAAMKLMKAKNIKAVLATRSADGMTLVHSNGNYDHYPAQAREVFDVSGAGDTVAACLATCIAANIPIDVSVKLANAAAGIVVAKMGTAVAYNDDLLGSITDIGAEENEKKVHSLQSLSKTIIEWKKMGYLVGFTNGCFDLIHPGHLSVIQKAKSLCDRLIVAVNSDVSIKAIKGEKRPIQNQNTRMAILSALSAVDVVIKFDSKTPTDLIKKLEPDKFFKGSDYIDAEIPESKIVESYGGEVVFVDLIEGHSTTSTINQIKKIPSH